MFRITEDQSPGNLVQCLAKNFKYFIILIVSTYYILCISWLVKCLTVQTWRKDLCIKLVNC